MQCFTETGLVIVCFVIYGAIIAIQSFEGFTVIVEAEYSYPLSNPRAYPLSNYHNISYNPQRLHTGTILRVLLHTGALLQLLCCLGNYALAPKNPM